METLENNTQLVNLDFDSEIYTMTLNDLTVETFTSYDDAFEYAENNNYRIDKVTGLDEVEYSNEVLALAQFLGCDAENIRGFLYDNNVFEYGNKEYLVCDDGEADRLNDLSIDSYIDDCVLPEIPEAYRNYFDDEKFKRDCAYDGRGHNLATYDGCENEETVNGETYYIYRTN